MNLWSWNVSGSRLKEERWTFPGKWVRQLGLHWMKDKKALNGELILFRTTFSSGQLLKDSGVLFGAKVVKSQCMKSHDCFRSINSGTNIERNDLPLKIIHVHLSCPNCELPLNGWNGKPLAYFVWLPNTLPNSDIWGEVKDNRIGGASSVRIVQLSR
jgi:hypothetical protein